MTKILFDPGFSKGQFLTIFYFFSILFFTPLSGANGAPAKLNTRDINTAQLSCKPSTFIVSLNNDDDNNDGKKDYLTKRPSKQEDNLRQFAVNEAKAKYIVLSEVVIVGAGASAVYDKKRKGADLKNNRLKAFRDKKKKKKKLKFGKTYKLPLDFYFEGRKTSGNKNDLELRYELLDEKKQHLCESKANGTVIDAQATFDVAKSSQGSNFVTNKKMLITASGPANSVWAPGGYIPTWSSDQNGTFGAAPGTNTVNALTTVFTAGQTLTPENEKDQHELKAKIIEKGLIIEAHIPVNITAPVSVVAYDGWTDRKKRTSPKNGYYGAQAANFTLFNEYIKYKLMDQFGKRITKSAWGDRKVQIKENIGTVLQSTIPAVQTWITNSLNWTQDWTTKEDGEINDRLRLQNAPIALLKRPIVNNRHQFLAVLEKKRRRDPGAIIMNLGTGGVHTWSASVNEVNPVIVTRNTFTVVVEKSKKKGGSFQIKIRSQYILDRTVPTK